MGSDPPHWLGRERAARNVNDQATILYDQLESKGNRENREYTHNPNIIIFDPQTAAEGVRVKQYYRGHSVHFRQTQGKRTIDFPPASEGSIVLATIYRRRS